MVEQTTGFAKVAACKKCGTEEEAGLVFHKSNTDCPPESPFTGEHIHRTCRVCGFQWPELPLG